MLIENFSTILRKKKNPKKGTRPETSSKINPLYIRLRFLLLDNANGHMKLHDS